MWLLGNSAFNYLGYRPVNNDYMLITDGHFGHWLKIIHLKEYIYIYMSHFIVYNVKHWKQTEQEEYIDFPNS